MMGLFKVYSDGYTYSSNELVVAFTADQALDEFVDYVKARYVADDDQLLKLLSHNTIDLVTIDGITDTLYVEQLPTI